MRIETFTVVAGSTACNARCPFCISKQTPNSGVPNTEPKVNWRNLKIGIGLAKANGVTTALITSKGEATLFPSQLNDFVYNLGREFPLVELQTNGLLLHGQRWINRLTEMYNDGLTTVALSVVHWENDKNREIYTPHKDEYPDLVATIKLLHDIGLSVRLTLMMATPWFDNWKDVRDLMNFSQINKVEQTTIRPVILADSNSKPEIAEWTQKHVLTPNQLHQITSHVEQEGTLVMTLPHGAKIYDYHGQNLCLADCLTLEAETSDLRQLIFFPDGALRYDWQYEGARLL